MLFGVLLSFFVSFFVCFLAWALSKRAAGDREKSSPFECGFDPKCSARVPFSVRFFLLAVIFLIFDIEIALLLPFPFVAVSGYSLLAVVATVSFLLILVVGLAHEWYEGSLDWVEAGKASGGGL
uniref:NADH-ubiquinone oxidoreductase chain 3 n=1 Tax=Notospermus geniculatus TaxID=416868 RepID=A0A4Y5RU31_9BILA|nr:NADH dehydrogenase subunit 3 [Notospermus geniculatus]QCZ36418.1 NADH dehydrogenase subunit 3 [Notospermus geniculatus]